MAGFSFSTLLLVVLPLTLAAAKAAEPIPQPGREPDRIIHPWKEGEWKGELPGEWKIDGPEKTETTSHMGGTLTIKNIQDPVLAYFAPPQKADRPAKGVIVCPGGGYNILAWDLEGTEVATYLSSQGFHAWVLKYRLPRKAGDAERHLPALQDAQRSISLLRSQAETLGLDPGQLGIMGFSAGGHLAAITGTSGNQRSYPARDAIDAVSCRPDWCALIYPAYLHASDDRKGLVPGPDAPRAFLSHSADDGLTYKNSSQFFDTLQSHKIPSELHIWPDGGHGYGMRSPQSPKSWPSLLVAWLGRE